ncbi:hypothetical protein Tco_0985141, partial [Tanacetum coccineum]
PLEEAPKDEIKQELPGILGGEARLSAGSNKSNKITAIVAELSHSRHCVTPSSSFKPVIQPCVVV